MKQETVLEVKIYKPIFIRVKGCQSCRWGILYSSKRRNIGHCW